jgi:GT2 family glycosyltransferase
VISVVVPTRDRSDALRDTLMALAAQQGAPFEVIVVDNGSRVPPAQALADLGADYPVPLRFVDEPQPGVSAARNRGVAEASGDRILFLNDDTAPLGDRLVAEHAERLAQAGPGTAHMGRIRYRDDQLRDPFMRFLNDHAQFTFEEMTAGPVTRPGRVYTAHLSLHRRDFEAAGGFDERLVFGFEDAEFASRFFGVGSVVYHPDLVTMHDHPISMRGWAERMQRMGAAGKLVNSLVEPPLAQVPAGPYWSLLAAASVVLERVPGRFGHLPARVRRAVYVALNQGAYTRGYRGA